MALAWRREDEVRPSLQGVLRRLLVLLGCVAVASCSTKAALQCDDWNTREFFRGATAEHVGFCLASGSSVSAVDDRGNTPLHWAALLDRPPATIAVLLGAGADARARARGGLTPLHKAAARSGDPAVIHMLVEAGASLWSWARGTGYPLHAAAWFNDNPAIIEAILWHGVGATQRRGSVGRTALHVAAGYNDNPEVVAALLRAGADPQAAYNNGFTPLHVAALASDHPDVIDLLLDAGADAKARSRAGRTAWDLARHNASLRGSGAYERLVRATSG